jgi:hypothetical protein
MISYDTYLYVLFKFYTNGPIFTKFCINVTPLKATLIYTFTLNITVCNATLNTSVFTLVLHVSATLGHHQVLLLLLLELFYCNFAFIFFYCTPIHLLDALSHFLLSAQVHFSVFNNFKI